MIKYIMAIAGMIGITISVVAASAMVQKPKIDPPETIKPLHGQVFYQEQMPLPVQAVLSVQIIDITQSQKVIAQTQIDIKNQMPVAFTLPLSAPDFVDDHLYGLQARISVGDVLWFTNAEPLPIMRDKESYIVRLEPVSMASPISTPKLGSHEWQANRIEGAATKSPSPTLLIEEEDTVSLDATTNAGAVLGKRYKVSGSGGCNRYFTTALIDEEKQKMHFSPIASTFMACADSTMLQENHFTDLLTRVRTYRLEETGHLYFLGEENEVLAQFEPLVSSK